MNTGLLLTINGWAGKNSIIDAFMVFCASYLVYVVFAVAAAVIVYYIYRREWKPPIYFFATLVATFVLLQLAGCLNVDHRPFMDHQVTQLVAHASGKSFPSDHTTVTSGIAFGLLFMTCFKKLGFVLLASAFLVGFARIFVGIHYPADIAGGLLTGLLGGAIAYAVKRVIDETAARTIAFRMPNE